MLRTKELDRFVDDLAASLKEQFCYIPLAPKESQAAYEASIKDSVIALVTALNKHIAGFAIDQFYSKSGYPGTHPIYSSKKEEIMATFTVFVDAIAKGPNGAGVTATGRNDSLPVVVWELLHHEVRNCYIGKEYIIRIDEADE